MTISKTGNPIARSTNGRPAPVHVKLQRINASFAKAHPPDGQGKVWWARLQKALGTSSCAFVNASLLQLQQAACLRGGSISEIGVNSALALIEAAEPRNEIEGALALQMACTHIASMAILARIEGGYTTERRAGLERCSPIDADLCGPGRGFPASAPGRLPVHACRTCARQRRRPSAHREREEGEQRRGRRQKLSVRAPGGPRALCSFIPFAPLPGEKV